MSLYNWIFGIRENEKKAEQVAKQASKEVEVLVEQAASDIKEAEPYAAEALVEVEHVTEEAEPYVEEALVEVEHVTEEAEPFIEEVFLEEHINSLNAIRVLNDMARALNENAIYTHQTKSEDLNLQTLDFVPPASSESDAKVFTLDELSELYLKLKYQLDSIKALGCVCEASE